jgi:hypothetical protein
MDGGSFKTVQHYRLLRKGGRAITIITAFPGEILINARQKPNIAPLLASESSPPSNLLSIERNSFSSWRNTSPSPLSACHLGAAA